MHRVITPNRLLLMAAIVAVSGCGESAVSGSGPTAMDAGQAEPADASLPPTDGQVADSALPVDAANAAIDAGPINDGGIELPDDTVTLEMNDNAVETGAVVTGADSTARFYSATRAAYWQIALSTPDGAAMGAGLQVSVTVDSEGRGRYLVYDPAERFAPMFFEAATPEMGEHSLEIDTTDALSASDLQVEFTPNPANPFAFTIGSLSVSISINGIMREIAYTAAFAVFANLVTGACNAIVPVYDDICSILGTVVTTLSGFVRPGIRVLTGAFATGREAAKEIGETLVGQIGEWGCNEGGQLLVKAFMEDDVRVLRDKFREAVSKYHYLLWLIEQEPLESPDDQAALTTLLEGLGLQLTAMAPQIREGYISILSATGSPATQSPLYAQVIDRTKDVMAAADFAEIAWEEVLTELMEKRLFGPLPTGGLVWVDVPTAKIQVSQETLSSIEPSVFGFDIAGCLVAVWQGFEQTYEDQGARNTARARMPQIYERAVDVALRAMDEAHAQFYGGEIMLECLVDEYEPNDTWQAAFASPQIAVAGRDPIRLRELSLCNVGEGSAREEDWYAFPMAAIEFNATARIRPPEGEQMGVGQRVCLEMLYYGETNELAGTPPTSVRTACGDNGNLFFDVGPVGIRRAIGERWSFLMVRVWADGEVPLSYDLSFAQ